MHIFSLFIYIAGGTLVLNLICMVIMYLKRSFHVTLVSGIVILGCLVSASLYLMTLIHGTELISKELAATLDIETESYQTAGSGESAAYAFFSKDGIECHIDASELLDSNVPDIPQTVEIYICTRREGFSWCYLSITDEICYILK